MNSRQSACAVALGVAFGLAALGGAAAQERLTMGATHSASSFYAYQVGVANFLNNQLDDADITVRELGGAEVSTEALLRGEVDMGISVTSSDYGAVEGEAPFGEPSESIRTLYFFAPLPLNFIVAEDSGLDSIAALDGEAFNPGGRGTSTEGQVELVFETLGVSPDFVRAEGSDALDAYQNRQLDGFVKAGLHPDGYIQQANSSRPVAFLSLDQAQAEKVAGAYPFFSVATVSTGGAYGGEGQEATTVQTAIGINTAEDLDEEIAYRIAEAVFSEAGTKAAAEVYAPAEDIDPVELTLSASVAPLHKGVVRYLQENGHEVPERLIPSGG